MTNTPNKPITLRDGLLSAKIWRNAAKEGAGYRYSVDLVRSYTDAAGAWHDATSFSGTELLRISRLAQQAYDRIADMRAADRSEPDTAAGPA